MRPPTREGSGMVGEAFREQLYHRSLLRCIRGKQWPGDAAQHIQEDPSIKNLRELLPREESSGTPDVPAEPPRQKSPIKTHRIHHTKFSACLHAVINCSRANPFSQRQRLPAPLWTMFIFLDRVQGAAAFPWEHSRGS